MGEAFACAGDHIEDCMPLIKAAEDIYLFLPTTRADLTATCSNPAAMPALLSADAENHNPCSHGLVRQVRNLAPKCIQECSQMCGPLGDAISGYFHGGKHKAMEQVCLHQEAFACAGDHIEDCMPLIKAAEDIHLFLPTTRADLTATCSEFD